MRMLEYRNLIVERALNEGASPESAEEIASSCVMKESRLHPSAWQSKTAGSLAAASVSAIAALHPHLFRRSQPVEMAPRSQLLTGLRNELLERFGITDTHQVAAIIPVAIRHKTITRARELAPDLFIPPPTRDELYRLLIDTNPSEATTHAENASYARSRVSSVFSAGEAWLEAAALRRRADILSDLAHNWEASVGSAPVGTASSLASSTGVIA